MLSLDLKRFEWRLRHIGDFEGSIDSGFVLAKDEKEAKPKITKATKTGGWKKKWRKDGEVFYKSNGDGRTVGPDKFAATQLLFFVERNHSEEKPRTESINAQSCEVG